MNWFGLGLNYGGEAHERAYDEETDEGRTVQR